MEPLGSHPCQRGGPRPEHGIRQDEAAFVAFLVHVLIPELNPGDVLVMDNLSVHKVAAVRRLLEEAGVTLLFQPPYSPEFNP
ncbi:MAG: hypothetical protein GY913_36130, partial [Proteobacteria bacterium]|nr:hypothetical protein [Pseudomonadota bacterium]